MAYFKGIVTKKQGKGKKRNGFLLKSAFKRIPQHLDMKKMFLACIRYFCLMKKRICKEMIIQ